jgi:hypothetical protein
MKIPRNLWQFERMKRKGRFSNLNIIANIIISSSSHHPFNVKDGEVLSVFPGKSVDLKKVVPATDTLLSFAEWGPRMMMDEFVHQGGKSNEKYLEKKTIRKLEQIRPDLEGYLPRIVKKQLRDLDDRGELHKFQYPHCSTFQAIV